MSQVLTVNDLAIAFPANQFVVRKVYRAGAIAMLVLLSVVAGRGQATGESKNEIKNIQVVDGAIDGNVYGVGKSIRINGTVKEGAIAFGGDVIVQGTVMGDVAAVGGSVIQLEGARIGGDVIVAGGTYRPAEKQPNRSTGARTVVFSGYEYELQQLMRNPTGLLSPGWSATYIGLRLLSILFWFVVSLILTAALPGTVSRGVARLQLTSLRVAAIGFLGALVVGFGVEACLFLLPTPVSVVVGLLTIMLIIASGIFGRVIIYAATGRWLQRRFLPMGHQSESMALLLGTIVWGILASLPYVWPFMIAFTIVLSLGLALTVDRGATWRNPAAL